MGSPSQQQKGTYQGLLSPTLILSPEGLQNCTLCIIPTLPRRKLIPKRTRCATPSYQMAWLWLTEEAAAPNEPS